MQDIHDIRPPVQIGTDPMLLWGGLGALAIVVLTGVCVFLFLKKRKRVPAEITAAVVDADPLETALTEMAALEQHLPDSTRVIYFELSRILKYYLGARFQTNCMEMTTAEFISALAAMPLEGDVKMGIRGFFRQADPIRYAGMEVAMETAKADLKQIRQLIKTVAES